MKLTSWNLRGLNRPGKYRMIKNMIQQKKPHIFFMQETKCISNTIGTILAKAWPRSQSMAVDAFRRASNNMGHPRNFPH